MYALIDTTTLLTCSAVGYPLPIVTWYFNGNAMPGVNGNELLLTNVSHSASGIYQCIFENIAGNTSSAEASFIVFSKYQTQYIDTIIAADDSNYDVFKSF